MNQKAKEALSCANCGGKSAADGINCDYCGKPIHTILCQNTACLQINPPGAKFCRACGQTLEIPETIEESEIFCPGCADSKRQEKMRKTKAGPNQIQTCPTCQGVWVDQRTLEKILQESMGNEHIKDLDSKPYLRCPICQELMSRRFPKVENIPLKNLPLLDLCHTHGAWFDPGEFQHLTTKNKTQAAAKL